eukprot:CAMPEP_0174726544 /NCGR_PEP_ID=MMETSP1094-20130205/48029_1 /TAXON_ID=156173 /ORGANISM="Chrysochromulina brevifilum, Strain UTEX LB 985" /LENGTH=216 /DNA_ID=CAMNT_0015928143 /DNA_START=946 /DNA_END=1598 /DNA_ORIENTATION=+
MPLYPLRPQAAGAAQTTAQCGACEALWGRTMQSRAKAVKGILIRCRREEWRWQIVQLPSPPAAARACPLVEVARYRADARLVDGRHDDVQVWQVRVASEGLEDGEDAGGRILPVEEYGSVVSDVQPPVVDLEALAVHRTSVASLDGSVQLLLRNIRPWAQEVCDNRAQSHTREAASSWAADEPPLWLALLLLLQDMLVLASSTLRASSRTCSSEFA